MKKAGFLAMALVGCLCFAFAACNSGDGKTLTEDTDFEALVSDKVTDTVWQSAFSNEAFAGCSWTVRDYVDGEMAQYIKGCFGYRKNGEITEVLQSYQHYLSEEGDVLDDPRFSLTFMARIDSETIGQYLSMGDSAYVYEEIPLTDEALYATLAFRFFAIDLAGYFGEFTYDETRSAYVCTTGLYIDYLAPFSDTYTFSIYDIEVKIVGGKVAYQRGMIDDREFTLCCYNFGETEVVIPEVNEPTE